MIDVMMSPNEWATCERYIKCMPDDAIMTEWGSGGSTIAWAKLMIDTQRLISIEHTIEWADKVREQVAYCPMVTSILVPELSKSKYSEIDEEHAEHVDARYFCPTNDIWDSDLFLVDGVCRGICLLMIKHMAPHATVILHDAERNWYDWALVNYEVVEEVERIKVLRVKAE